MTSPAPGGLPPGSGQAGAPHEPDSSQLKPALRRRLTWASLGLLLLAMAVSHGLEATLRYPLGDAPLRYGNYGLELAQLEPPASRPRVVLLGNSVYQMYGIVPLMREQLARDQRDVELLNLAQLGSGIDDHVIQSVKASDAQPDLIVCCLAATTFSSSLPPFRTDSHSLCFDPHYLSRLPGAFYRRHFGLGETLAGASTSVIPFARTDSILRHSWADSSAGRPTWLYELLRFPTLNMTQEAWDTSAGGVGPAYTRSPPYDHALEAIDELLALAADVPVLVIWQESGLEPDWAADLGQSVRARVERHPGSRLVDLRQHWDAARFSDIVHPNLEEQAPYARRHLEAILAALPPG